MRSLFTTLSNGKPVTSMTDDDSFSRSRTAGASTRVRSYIYVLEGDKFKLIWQADDILIRKIGKRHYSSKLFRGEGFEGKMYAIDYADGRFKNGSEIKLPQGVNIYDFQYVYAPDGRRALFAWGDNGRPQLL